MDLELNDEAAADKSIQLLSAVGHERVATMFLEWVQDEQYWRTVKRLGGKWFKIGVYGDYTTSQLFKMFIKELAEELSAVELSAYYSQLEEASKNFGGL